MKQVFLKPEYRQEILNHCTKDKINSDTILQGTKYKALYFLIEKKGVPVKSTDPKLNGKPALYIGDNLFVVMVRIWGKDDSFFPCVMKTYLLELDG